MAGPLEYILGREWFPLEMGKRQKGKEFFLWSGCISFSGG
jgi:hypothetical protein